MPPPIPVPIAGRCARKPALNAFAATYIDRNWSPQPAMMRAPPSLSSG
ncbi:hypothetical protein MMEU_4427 [Mycobacterium marinum str. Europe]|nr:hypothetical protein MMEU_4427 [Mycobacterium marinum str. Europe]